MVDCRYSLQAKYINWLVVAKALPILIYILFPGMVGIGVIVDTIISLYVFFQLNKHGFLAKIDGQFYLKLWLAALLLGFLHSIISGLSRGMMVTFVIALLDQVSILFIFSVLDVEYVYLFLKAFIRFFVPLGIFSSFFWEGYLTFDTPHIMTYLTLFAFTLFYWPLRYRCIIIAALVFALMFDASVRSCTLSVIVSLSIAFLFSLWPKNHFVVFPKTVHLALYALPIVFSILGASGKFNVFQALEEQSISFELGGRKHEGGRSTNVDSRTIVYLDAMSNIRDPKTLILGHGPAYLIRSISNVDVFKNGRGRLEAGILNILVFYGLFGCVAFFLLCYKSSSSGLKANNNFCKLVALFVAYKFLFAFIEDPSINFTTYLAMGICLNRNIRDLTDNDILKKINSI